MTKDNKSTSANTSNKDPKSSVTDSKVESSQQSNDQPIDDKKAALEQLAADLKSSQNKDKKSTPKKSAETNTVRPQSAKVKTKNTWTSRFALFFSLIAVIGAALLWWQASVWLDNQNKLDELKSQNIVSTQQTLTQLQTELNQLKNTQTDQLKVQQQRQDDVQSIYARLSELSQSQPNYWLAAEAGYLIELAERRLLIEQDVNTAIQLLLDANARLTAMQDPSVFAIREAISGDVANLYAVVQPETDAVYLALSGLINQVEQLPFAQAYIPTPEDTAVEEEITTDIADWKQNLLTSFQRFFANFVTIKHRNAEVQPQLPADQQWFVKANITTQLLMAQHAALNNRNEIYQDAIKKLNLWLQQYFIQDDLRVLAFEQTLSGLGQKHVGLIIPDSLASQAIIANFLQQQMQLRGAQ